MAKYQPRVDPLDLLRNYCSQKKKIKVRDGSMYFDQIKFPFHTETPWLSTNSHKQYDLGALWLLMDAEQKGQSNFDYLERCSKEGVDLINVADKEEILAYFSGQVDSTPAINNQLKIEIGQRQSKREQKNAEEQKRNRPDDQTQDINYRVIEWVCRFQRPIQTCRKMLDTPSKSYRDVLRSIKLGVPRVEPQVNKKTKLAQIYEKKSQPIIIVPDTSQPGNVCIKNIRRLLENGEYAEASNCEDLPMRKIEITHKMRDRNIIFQITNNPTLLTPGQWECVIAIFVLGRTVQFNGWPQTNIQRLFGKYKGFFVKYDKAKVSDVRDWNVKPINVQQNTRYEDAEVSRNIWDEFEKILYAPVE